MWINPGEIPGDNIDNDNNGYVDDIYGWDFYNNDATVCHYSHSDKYDIDKASPEDNDNHGTHVAGTIAAIANNNIGIAVGVDDGLTVPVLLNAHTMSLQQISANTKRIAENARAGKLEGYGQGNFTITNLGMFGVEEFSAIVNPPEPAILAVGAAREAVVVKDGAMKPGRVMTMTLSCDHRLIDGLLAAKFMARLKELLETPSVLA
jgi:pyruvate/2-oxoglutarate dehydrogenase complex dihydrolipoamide acyltransferase (E2) component